MFIFQSNSELTSVRISSSHKPVAIETHRTAIAIPVPFWRPGQFHLKVDPMSPIMIKLFYYAMIVNFRITLVLWNEESKNILKML